MDMTSEEIKEFHEGIDNLIKEHGHADFRVAGLGSYTVGLSDRGFELFSPLSFEFLPTVYNHIAQLPSVEDGLVTEIDSLQVKGEPLRVKLKEITDRDQIVFIYQNLTLAVAQRYPIGSQTLYNVYVGDKNNLLPGEPGYDTGWKQNFASLRENVSLVEQDDEE